MTTEHTGAVPQPPKPDFFSVQAHYDKSDRIIRMFIDPETMMYSCALWRQGIESLAEAQVAKVDHSLAKLNLQKGSTLLDIGFGYGYTLKRAREVYGVRGIGLNLSQAQVEHAQQAATDPGLEYRLQGWEDFQENVDAIISIGAFEHFGRANYQSFFQKMHSMLPEGGRMLLHTIVFDQIPKTMDFARYARFIHTRIFPNGELPDPEQVIQQSQEVGFTLLNLEALKTPEGESHYVRTLDTWANNLELRRDVVVVVAGEETFKTNLKYLRESAYWFRQKAIDVHQYLLLAN